MRQDPKARSERFTTTFLLKICPMNGKKLKLERPSQYLVISHQSN